MAKGVINLQKESGGVTKITSTDGVSNTELVLPESGNLVSVDTAVIDNAIARYDGTTGKLQNSSVIIGDNDSLTIGKLNIAPMLIFNRGTDGQSLGYLGNASASSVDLNLINSSGAGNLNLGAGNNANVNITSGNLLLTSGTGALGYGTGAGGTVTQLTSKGTSVTLNKPTGRITMNNSALASGASVQFALYNSLIAHTDMVYCQALTSNVIYRVEVYSVYNGGCSISVKNEAGVSLSDALGLVFCVIKGAIS